MFAKNYEFTNDELNKLKASVYNEEEFKKAIRNKFKTSVSAAMNDDLFLFHTEKYQKEILKSAIETAKLVIVSYENVLREYVADKKSDDYKYMIAPLSMENYEHELSVEMGKVLADIENWIDLEAMEKELNGGGSNE